MRPRDPALPDFFTREQARAAGLSGSQIKTRVKNGTWRALRRGAYCLESRWADSDERGRHVLLTRAALHRVDEAWASHVTAAALHGLPLPRGENPVWLTRLPPRGTWYGTGLTIEAATLPLVDQWTVSALPTTSLRRTVADCLRHCLPADGLAVADAAASRRPELLAEVERVLHDCGDWPYAERGRRVLALADGRRESPLESWSFWYMHQFGVPIPEPQVSIHDRAGRFVGRVDAWWEQFGVIGEADGRVKYAITSADDVRKAERALFEEKQREDRLRATGADVVRWGAADLADPAAWASQLMQRLRANDRNRFAGAAVVTGRSA